VRSIIAITSSMLTATALVSRNINMMGSFGLVTITSAIILVLWTERGKRLGYL